VSSPPPPLVVGRVGGTSVAMTEVPHMHVRRLPCFSRKTEFGSWLPAPTCCQSMLETWLIDDYPNEGGWWK
jgi:hypothetical protein